MSKRGIFYTTAAIALTLVTIFTYGTFYSFNLNEKMDVIETRIGTVNFFIRDIERDINNGVFIAGFRTFLSFNDYIATSGLFIDDVNSRFKESFLNGTINNAELNLMRDTTFTEWAKRISARANKIDIFFNFTINDIKLNQSDPWNVIIGLDITLEVRDKRNTSYWVRNKYITSKINIIDFEDPLYIVNSEGRVTNPIIKSNITEFVVNGDVTNLLAHTSSSYYTAHEDSPSFLMRFEGNLGNSTYGIESLVNLEEFLGQGLALKDRSVVDYIYFGTQSTVNYRINKTPEWFKIDSGHLVPYMVNGTTCAPSECVIP
ncbi:MAG: hypothetical protein AABX33_08965 [Nanoarchaeota archaeon]